jgi:hypothetical protein
MADVTIYKPAAVTVSVIDGDPPADQTAVIVSLQAQVAALNALVTSLQAKIAAAQAALA